MLKLAYRFDKDGYFFGICNVQEDEKGEVMLPDDCTLLAPVFVEGTFAKFVDGAWTNEAYPTNCAQAIAEDFTCISNSPDPHQQQCKQIIESLVEAQSEDFRTKVDDNMVMSIEEITEEEKKTKEDEAAQAELDADIAAVREDMMTAIAIGDDEWLEELRAEYEELVNGGEI